MQIEQLEQVGYRKGYVYKIVCNETGEQYIGSTFNFENRISKHKAPKNTCVSKQIIDRGNYHFEIIFECFVPNRTELRKIEQSFIDSNECINKVPAYVSEEQQREKNIIRCKNYYNANVEKIKNYKSEYYKQNAERINQIKFNCGCGGKYTHQKKSRHFKSKKHQQFEQNQN